MDKRLCRVEDGDSVEDVVEVEDNEESRQGGKFGMKACAEEEQPGDSSTIIKLGSFRLHQLAQKYQPIHTCCQYE